MQLSAPKDGLLVDKLEGGGGDVGPASPSSPGSPGGSSGGKVSKGGEGGKPVKVLPCPRCESMNTKFCYYNNYSVNQPRHFCRQCQRYWTAGGTLRNVPVGGGSRKKSRHQRGSGGGAGEPCMVRGGGAGSPLAMARSGAGGNPPHHVLNSFQQLLTQDMVGMNFPQLSGYGGPQNHHFAPYSLDPCQGVYPPLLGGSHKPEQEELPPMHAMYGASVPMPGAFSYCADMGGENLGGAKAEYAWAQGGQPQGGQMLGGYSQGQSVWEQSTRHTSASPRSAVEDESGGARSSAGAVAKNGYESSMLLNLGLNSWPAHQQVQQVGKQQPTPAAWDPHQTHPAHQHHPVSTTTTTAGTKPLQTTNGSSPPHGSSTIEEEGSTPTNGYSTSGYEEGDAVSSMWHDMHDMQDIFQ